MRVFQILFISIVLIFTFSCKKNSSNLNQATAQIQWCYPNGPRSNSYFEAYKNLKDNDGNTLFTVNKALTKEDINDTEELEAYTKYVADQNKQLSEGNKAYYNIKNIFSTLSNVPKEYVDYAFKERKIPVNFITDMPSSISLGGVTLLTSATPPFHAIRILYSPEGTLLHEFGHAVESYIYDKETDKSQTFAKDLETLSKSFIGKYKVLVSEYLREDKSAVSKVQRDQQERSHEAFAELFDSWYCSKSSRKLLKEGIIDAYKFAKKYLITPYDFEKEEDDLDKTDLNIEGDITIGVIQDKKTKKVWANQGETKKTWEQASNYCKNLKVNDLSFQLPSCNEIAEFYQHNMQSDVFNMSRSNGAMYGFSGPSWSTDTDKDKIKACGKVGSYPRNSESYSKTQELAFLCVSSSTN